MLTINYVNHSDLIGYPFRSGQGQFPAGRWHSLEVLEEGTVVFDAKDGKYKKMLGEDIMAI